MHPCAHAGLIMHIEVTHVPMDNSEVEYESVGVYKTIISSIIYLLCYLFSRKQMLLCMLSFYIITPFHASMVIIVLHVCLSKETLFFEVHCLGSGREK